MINGNHKSIDTDYNCVNQEMIATSKKVKISTMSPTGRVQSSTSSLAQIHLARIAQEKAKAHERELDGVLD